MSLARIVWRNVAQRGLSSALTALSIALGVALVVTILSLERQARDRFDEGAQPFDLVVGARGSATQLVLNTVYHLDQSPGNIPYAVYEELRDDRQYVRAAAPIAVGDAYRGHRVVGTSDALLTEILRVEMEGRVFAYSDEKL
jgi:putative ABC transport system permease protein